jgi:catechol 2,3-dioxygenase-like lactoylglutathione lyase family enzyme
VLLDHVQLGMPAGREAEARSFFGEILGMNEEEKPENLRGRGGCWFRRGGCVVHLGVDPDFRPQGKAHPAFAVSDLQNLALRLEAAGFGVSWDQAIPGVVRFYTTDPFGNRLEFISEGQGLSQSYAG